MSRAPSMRSTTRPGASAANGSTGRAAHRKWADGGDSTPSSSAPNQPPARGPGSSESGGRRPRQPSTRSSSRGPSTRTWCSNAPAFTPPAPGPSKADDDFVQAYALGSRDPKLIETIARNEALFHRAVAQAPDSAATLWSQRGDDHAQAAAMGRGRRGLWAGRPAPTGGPHASVTVKSSCSGPLGNLISFSERVPTSSTGSVGQPLRVRRMTPPGMCSLAPGMDAHLEVLVRLAELAVNGAPDARSKGRYLNTLGAALYRAGRFEDAIRRLDEGIQLKGGTSEPRDWVFLAMAHHRLGHRDEARRYLESAAQPPAEHRSRPVLGRSWRSVSFAARPRQRSSTIRSSRPIRSH